MYEPREVIAIQETRTNGSRSPECSGAPYPALIRSRGVIHRQSTLVAVLGISSLMHVGCSPVATPDVAPPSVVTPPPTSVAATPARDRVPRPLPEPDMRSRFAPQLDVLITVSRNGVLEALTLPSAICTATLVLSSGRVAVPDGLRPERVADRIGKVAWTYEPLAAGAGTGFHTVSCARGGVELAATAPVGVP